MTAVADMVLDIHAHTALTGLFVYGNSYDDVYRYERHIVFPKILAQNCEDFLRMLLMMMERKTTGIPKDSGHDDKAACNLLCGPITIPKRTS